MAAAAGRVWQDGTGKQDGTGVGSLQQQYGGKGRGGNRRDGAQLGNGPFAGEPAGCVHIC